MKDLEKKHIEHVEELDILKSCFSNFGLKCKKINFFSLLSFIFLIVGLVLILVFMKDRFWKNFWVISIMGLLFLATFIRHYLIKHFCQNPAFSIVKRAYEVNALSDENHFYFNPLKDFILEDNHYIYARRIDIFNFCNIENNLENFPTKSNIETVWENLKEIFNKVEKVRKIGQYSKREKKDCFIKEKINYVCKNDAIIQLEFRYLPKIFELCELYISLFEKYPKSDEYCLNILRYFMEYLTMTNSYLDDMFENQKEWTIQV